MVFCTRIFFTMQTIIISDIHLGSPHSCAEEFIHFLDTLPAEANLIINGDVVDHWHRDLTGIHLQALEHLQAESYNRQVIWIRGNHDEKYELVDPAKIEFTDDYHIDKRLYISHGYNFDNVMPYHKLFIIFFKTVHRIRVKLGAESMHVAHYAKQFPKLYEFLKSHVSKNAIIYAKENGYTAVTCGHTHFIEDKTIDGIRYLNTGAWTEQPISYIRVTDNKIELLEI